jgi:hypothetical protein
MRFAVSALHEQHHLETAARALGLAAPIPADPSTAPPTNHTTNHTPDQESRR